MDHQAFKDELKARCTPIHDNICAVKGEQYAAAVSIQAQLIQITNLMISAKSRLTAELAANLLTITQAELCLWMGDALAAARGKGESARDVATELLDDYSTLHKQIQAVIHKP